MDTINKEHACAFTGHRPERLSIPDSKVIAWLDKEIKKAVEAGLIERNASVVSIVTGNGLKDVNNAIRAAGEPISIKPETGALLEAFEKIQNS